MAKDRGNKKAGNAHSSALVNSRHVKQASSQKTSSTSAGNRSVKHVDFKQVLHNRAGKKVRELKADGANLLAATIVNTADGILGRQQALGVIQEDAARRGGDFERQVMETKQAQEGGTGFEDEATNLNPAREAENTRRRFWSELRKVLAAADIIVEVLDARDPASCRSAELEREVAAAGKRLILLLNKVDLIPRSAAAAWVTHLSKVCCIPTMTFKSARSGTKRAKHAMVSLENAPDGLLRSTHGVVGADELMQLLKNYARTGGGRTKAHVSVGIVGYPNCGKSSVINSMKRHAAVEVGGRAGVTKQMQEVKLDSKVTLIDSPGVVFEGSSSDPSVVLRNVVRPELVDDPVGVVEALVSKAPRKALLQFYGYGPLKDTLTPHELLVQVARTRGKLKRAGGLDLPSAARSIIADWTAGKIRYYVLPPDCSEALASVAEAESAEIVSTLAPDFDIDALFNGDESAEPATVLGAPATENASSSRKRKRDGSMVTLAGELKVDQPIFGEDAGREELP